MRSGLVSSWARRRKVVALSGGVGGAKLALGLSRILNAGNLTVVANTGDDFEHLGLHISPDIDTLTYALAGVDNPVTGWGRRDETWRFMDALGQLGAETWFRLGDQDLAIHVERTRRLRQGESLSGVTQIFTARFGITSHIIPMTDDCVRTRVATDEGVLDFQDYFVRRQCTPRVSGFVFEGVKQASFHPRIVASLQDPDLFAVVICPSNPFISIDPILAVPGAKEAIAAAGAPVIVISPVIAGRAIKGPTDKIMRELCLEVSAVGIAQHYRDVADGFVLDAADQSSTDVFEIPNLATHTIMQTIYDREHLASATLDFAGTVAKKHRRRKVRH